MIPNEFQNDEGEGKYKGKKFIFLRLYKFGRPKWVSRSTFVADTNRVLNSILRKGDEFRGAIVTNNLPTVSTMMLSEPKPKFRLAVLAASNFLVWNPFRRAIQAPLGLKYGHIQQFKGLVLLCRLFFFSFLEVYFFLRCPKL